MNRVVRWIQEIARDVRSDSVGGRNQVMPPCLVPPFSFSCRLLKNIMSPAQNRQTVRTGSSMKKSLDIPRILILSREWINSLWWASPESSQVKHKELPWHELHFFHCVLWANSSIIYERIGYEGPKFILRAWMLGLKFLSIKPANWRFPEQPSKLSGQIYVILGRIFLNEKWHELFFFGTVEWLNT